MEWHLFEGVPEGLRRNSFQVGRPGKLQFPGGGRGAFPGVRAECQESPTQKISGHGRHRKSPDMADIENLRTWLAQKSPSDVRHGNSPHMVEHPGGRIGRPGSSVRWKVGPRLMTTPGNVQYEGLW